MSDIFCNVLIQNVPMFLNVDIYYPIYYLWRATRSRANLIRVTSPPNSTPRQFPCYPLLYFLFIFSLLRCTLPDFPSVYSPASLSFLSCCHLTTIGIIPKLLYLVTGAQITYSLRHLCIPPDYLCDEIGQNLLYA